MEVCGENNTYQDKSTETVQNVQIQTQGEKIPGQFSTEQTHQRQEARAARRRSMTLSCSTGQDSDSFCPASGGWVWNEQA